MTWLHWKVGMVKRTLELFECDICGEEGQRYQVVFEEGTKILDRCLRHGKSLEKLRDEQGEWVTPKSGKSSFRKSSLAELRLAVSEGRQADGKST